MQRRSDRRSAMEAMRASALQSPGGDFHGATCRQTALSRRSRRRPGLQSPGGDFHGATPIVRKVRYLPPGLKVAVPRRGFSRCNILSKPDSIQPFTFSASCSPPEGIFTVQPREKPLEGTVAAGMDLLQSPGGDFHGATLLDAGGLRAEARSPVAVPRRGFSRCNVVVHALRGCDDYVQVAVPRRGFSRCNCYTDADLVAVQRDKLQSPGGDFHGATTPARGSFKHLRIGVAVPRRGFSRCN